MAKRLSRAELKGKVQTVLGTIDPARLGSTLMQIGRAHV